MTDPVNVPREWLEAVKAELFCSAGERADDLYDEARTLLAAAPKAEPVSDLPPISFDGPHKPNDHRVWLARQLLDSKNDDATAYGIVAFHPAISDLWKKSKTFKSIKPEAPKVEQEPVAWMTSGGDVTRSHVFAVEQSANDLVRYPKPLYTHPAPSSDELLDALERLVKDWHEGKLTTVDLFNGIDALIAKRKGPQS